MLTLIKCKLAEGKCRGGGGKLGVWGACLHCPGVESNIEPSISLECSSTHAYTLTKECSVILLPHFERLHENISKTEIDGINNHY